MRLTITLLAAILFTFLSLATAIIYSSFTTMDEASTCLLAIIVTCISYLCLYGNYEEGKNVLKEIIKLNKPKRKLQIDSFSWFEKGNWITEVIKCKSNKSLIYLDSYFDEESEKYIIEYYIK